MNWLKKLAILASFSFFLSCGIQEYYYLPQVPESYITSSLTDSATIILPRIPQEYYYATNYSIYYRIYISGESVTSIQTSNLSVINPELSRDYNSLSRYTDPTGTSVTTLNTFDNLKYYEIELDGEDIENIFTKDGGTLRILFQTISGSYPSVTLDEGDEIRLLRSGQLTSPLPPGDLFFRNTPELNDSANATAENNADVSGRTEITQRYAYVSMYIVARGYNNEIFSQIFGKPTHIHIFRLPEMN